MARCKAGDLAMIMGDANGGKIVEVLRVPEHHELPLAFWIFAVRHGLLPLWWVRTCGSNLRCYGGMRQEGVFPDSLLRPLRDKPGDDGMRELTPAELDAVTVTNAVVPVTTEHGPALFPA